ncbi:MAG: hypothetical protein HZB44_00225 [Actinobacteria bacterium]|nr:hypothetical protein [Actinomycetota bacterium]
MKASRLGIFVAVFLFVAMVFAWSSFAGASPSLSLTSPTHSDENTWYTGNTPSFNWSSSSPLSEITLNQPLDVAVSGGYAYVAEGVSGLTIVDISNTDAPGIVGGYNTPGTAGAVAVVQQYAYVADGTTMQIIDVSDPANASFAAYMNLPHRAMAIQGNMAYLIHDDILEIYTIDNPATPFFQSSIYIPSVVALDVEGNYLYVVCGGVVPTLKILDVSNPHAPAITSSVWVPSPEDIAVQVNPVDGKPYAYVSGQTPEGLRIIDVSSPTSPVTVGAYNTFNTAMAASGSTVYLAVNDIWTHDAALSVLDASIPASPTWVRGYGFYPKGSFYGTDMALSGDDVYVVGSGKMRIYHTAPIQYSHVLDQSPTTSPDNIPEGSVEPGASASYTAAALADGEYYFHVASIEGTSVGPVSHRRVRIGSTCGQAPGLSLGISGVRWASFADYQARSLTVDFDVTNPSGPSAYGTTLTGTVNSNGVTADSALPQLVGDTAIGNTTTVSLRYHVPAGVSYFRTQAYATAQDPCGASYDYPGPFPGV